MKILILGLGNPLFKDDGTGPRVIRVLQREHLPAGVEALEDGGSFFNYWSTLLKCRYVIAVDSMLGGGSPGTIYMVKPEEINRAGAAVPGLRHEIHFLDVLEMAAVHGARPGVTIIGVEPGEISFSLELSPAIEAKLPEITGVVRECLQSMLAGS